MRLWLKTKWIAVWSQGSIEEDRRGVGRGMELINWQAARGTEKIEKKAGAMMEKDAPVKQEAIQTSVIGTEHR